MPALRRTAAPALWLAALGTVCAATAVHAAQPPYAVPSATPSVTPSVMPSVTRSVPALQGRAWRLADEADKAYARRAYATTLSRAEAALRLRPDVPRLHQLRVYALQQLGRMPEAIAAAAQAIAAGHGSPALQAALGNLQPGAAREPAAATSDAYRRAYPIAAQAYQEDQRGNPAAAARHAEAAFRIDPSQGAWALLWIDALQKQDLFAASIDAARAAIAAGAPNPDELNARLDDGQRATASRHAEAAYRAVALDRQGEALQQARNAWRLAPTVSAYRWLLLDQLRAVGQPLAAEQAASQMLQADAGLTAVRLLRSVLRQQLGRADAAQDDIDVLLSQRGLTDATRRDARLIGADLARVAGRPARVRALLVPLAADDAQAVARRRLVDAAVAVAASAPGIAAIMPLQLCRVGATDTVCELKPWDDAGTDLPVVRANVAYAQKRHAQAIAFARAAVVEDPVDDTRQTLLTTTLAAGDAWQRDEALQRLNRAIAARPGDATLLRQRAFLHQADGHPERALADFVAARATGRAPPQNTLDEAYARAAVGDRRAAAGLLREALDAAARGTLPLDAQQRYDTRSSASAFARQWGASVTVGYRGARAASNGLVGQPVSVPGSPVFSTSELFWRPPELLNSSSRTFEVYGRLLTTLRSGTDTFTSQVVDNPCGGSFQVPQSQSRGIAGLPTTTGALGVRFTPSADLNVVFGLERQFMLGSATRSGAIDPAPAELRCRFNTRGETLRYQSDTGSGGWQAYVAYGVSEGTAIRMDTNQWFTMEGYVQAGYALLDMPARWTVQDNASGDATASGDGRLRRGLGFASGELRVGRSYMTAYSEQLVIFPHVIVAADWLSSRQRVRGVPVGGFDSFDLRGNAASWSAGAGVGVNLRYWLREDRYNAQRSRIDTSLQYRTSLGGGQADRAKGLFLSVSLSY